MNEHPHPDDLSQQLSPEEMAKLEQQIAQRREGGGSQARLKPLLEEDAAVLERLGR